MATVEPRPKIIPLEVLYSEALFTGETAPRLLAHLTQAGAKPLPVGPNVLDSLSERDVSQGLLATFALQEVEWSLEELASLIKPQSPDPNLLLILDQLQDPGNLGTLLRTADAVGVKAVILLEPCVDPFDPKTVRGTMGSIFSVPFARTANFAALVSWLTNLGYRLVGADGRRGEPPWENDPLRGSVALALGNEARGLSPVCHHHLTDYVSLPLRGQAESLNVAVAGGALMYEWLRINQVSSPKT